MQATENQRGGRRRHLHAALLALVAISLSAGVGTASASPFAGDGVWVWYVSASGGSAKAIAKQADRAGIDTVYVKSSDGGSAWSQFTPQLVRTLHSRGIKACAWPFVYGDHPKREASLSARAVRMGADCLVIDAESSYEGRYEQAYRYIRKLRRLVGPKYPIGLASFPYVDYHPTFPYSVFLGKGGARANLPQLYWKDIGDSVRAAFAHTYRWNRGYGRKIFPLGQTYQDPGKREILDFRKYAREYGSTGVSWWSWQETSSSEWRQISRPLKRGIPGFKAQESFAELERGDSGDPVLFAQELLRAWGIRTRRNGSFNRRTERAVTTFQLEQALEPTGLLDDPTWEILIQRHPKSTNWKRTKVPGKLDRRSRIPATAPGRARRNEIPSTPGRP